LTSPKQSEQAGWGIIVSRNQRKDRLVLNFFFGAGFFSRLSAHTFTMVEAAKA